MLRCPSAHAEDMVKQKYPTCRSYYCQMSLNPHHTAGVQLYPILEMRQLSIGRLAPAYCLSWDWRGVKSSLELRMLLPKHANRALPAAPSLSLRRKVSFQSSVHSHCIPRPSLWFSDFRMRGTSPLRLQAVLQHGAKLCEKISRARHPPKTKPPTHAEFPIGCELPPPAARSSSPTKHASILPLIPHSVLGPP